MMSRTSQQLLSPQALAWVEQLFKQRIDNALVLTQMGPGLIELRISGYPKAIRFRGVQPAFLGHGVVSTCMTWDSESDGWHSPIPGRQLIAPTSQFEQEPIRTLQTSDGIELNYDVPGLLYWLFLRIEEQGAKDLDSHGRFPAKHSHAYAHGYLERPIADEWFQLLRQMASRVWPALKLQKDEFSIQPSHDVDFPCRYTQCSPRYIIRSLAQDVLRKRSINALYKGLRNTVSALNSQTLPLNDPYNTFDWIMSQSERLGLASEFYFICGGNHPLDPGYDPRHKAIRNLIRNISSRGHIVGLHPSYQSSGNHDILHQEWNTFRAIATEEGIDQSSWGLRMHYLRNRFPEQWRHFSEIGVQYDASMGYADHVGFRAGTSKPYLAFDTVNQRPLPLTVKPLIAMEGTLYSPAYMGVVEPTHIAQKLADLRSTCRLVDGVFSLLWHNSEFVTTENRELYLSALDEYKNIQ